MRTLELPFKTVAAWRAFWEAKTEELSTDGLYAQVGDTSATVRATDTGNLIEQFTTGSTALTIESRLIAAVLDRATFQYLIPKEHNERWRQFWLRRESVLIAAGLLPSITDDGATITCGDGALLTFSPSDIPADIETRLQALMAVPA